MKKFLIYTLISLLLIGIAFRVFCGIFVIQPIGSMPKGATFVYWRSGINLPFIESADGYLDKKGYPISAFARGTVLMKYTETIKQKQIVRFNYSESLYLYTTGGKKYNE